jgi:DUF2934 family protein
MPRSSKSQPAAPTGPRLVKAAPKTLAESNITEAQIALRAYEFFIQEGFTHGHDVDHWLRAERELKGVAPVPRPKRIAATRAQT